MLTYQEALHQLLGLTDYERMAVSHGRQPRYDLSRVAAFLDMLGKPHMGRPTVHVAGTKGKGSTVAMVSAALVAQGMRTGLYTSPHLHTFRERIQLDNQPVSEATFSGLLESLWPVAEALNATDQWSRVTVFEMLTAMAFVHFRDVHADAQVIEVGLGGRLDATNVMPSPEVCVITPVSLDHTGVLGSTVAQIAVEKAGIIKPGSTIVAGLQQPEAMAVIEATCAERSARLIKVADVARWRHHSSSLDGQSFTLETAHGTYDLWTRLLGTHQIENAATAVVALEALRERGVTLSEASIRAGIRDVVWPCRLEVLRRSPLVVCDGAHNPEAARRLRESVPAYFKYRRLIMVAGISGDKDIDGIVAELAALRPRVLTSRSRHPRATPPDALAKRFRTAGCEAEPAGNTAQALDRALAEAGPDDLVLVTGSLFAAAEAREALKGITPEVYPDLLPGNAPTRQP